MQAVVDYVGSVAENFKSKLGPSLYPRDPLSGAFDF
jgi:hypothetical protein